MHRLKSIAFSYLLGVIFFSQPQSAHAQDAKLRDYIRELASLSSETVKPYPAFVEHWPTLIALQEVVLNDNYPIADEMKEELRKNPIRDPRHRLYRQFLDDVVFCSEGDPHVRLIAFELLLTMQNPPLESFMAILTDPTLPSLYRLKLLHHIKDKPPTTLVSALVAMLKNPRMTDPHGVEPLRLALEAIGNADKEAVFDSMLRLSPLTHLIGNDSLSPILRREAVRTFGKILGASATQDMCYLAQHDISDGVRMEAIDFLLEKAQGWRAQKVLLSVRSYLEWMASSDPALALKTFRAYEIAFPPQTLSLLTTSETLRAEINSITPARFAEEFLREMRSLEWSKPNIRKALLLTHGRLLPREYRSHGIDVYWLDAVEEAHLLEEIELLRELRHTPGSPRIQVAMRTALKMLPKLRKAVK